ncbi:MAG: protein kinase [Vicinamibacteria bacterium]
MPLKPGSRLGTYEVLSPIGAGAMGEVYRAKDLKLGRDVAIKVLPEEFASDAERLRRFEQEARATSALNHPNIITIHDIGEQEGTHYIAMELVEGKTLREVLEDGPVPTTKMLGFASQVAQGIAKAHAAGIVHRDLKPENLMVTNDGFVKILDFGLAKLLPQASDSGSQMATLSKMGTQVGVILGTVQYMSPEQAVGRTVDFRSDQFSFGSILYEMATGKRAFERESMAQTMTAIIESTPEPATSLSPNLPSHLGVILKRCLAKDPNERYESTHELTREIGLVSVEDVGSRTKGRRWTAAGILLAVLVVVVGLNVEGLRDRLPGLASLPSMRSKTAPTPQMIVVLPFENLGLSEDEYFAAGMTDEITSRLGAVSGLGIISRKRALRYAGTEKTTREIGEELGVGYILVGSVRWASGGDGPTRVRITPELIRASDGTQLWSEPYDRVIDDIFEVQSDIAGQVIQRLGVTLLDKEHAPLTARPTENLEAYTLYLKGRHFWNKRTASDIQTALDYFHESVDLDPGYALAHVGIADVWIFRGWYSVLAPKETFPKAKAAVLKALQFDEALAEAHTSLAHIHFEFDHDWEAARKEYERGIELNPRHPTAHHWYGGFLSAMGEHEEGLRQAEKAQELDPLSLIINTWVGLRHYFAGRYEVAIEEYQKALELGSAFAPGHWHLGWAYEQAGRYPEAIAEAQRAIEISDGNPLYIASLGHAHAKAGNEDEARTILDRLEQESATRHVSAYHVAVIYAALGDTDRAFERLEGAFEERSPWIGYMKVDPRVDPLRSDPRFDELLRKARLDF